MFNHLLIALALASLSIVSNAAATLMDADQAEAGIIPNAVLHKEVAVNQGGDSDRDVAAVLAVSGADSCAANAVCTRPVAPATAKVATANEWLAAQGNADSGESFMVLWIIIAVLVFFGVRKSESTK